MTLLEEIQTKCPAAMVATKEHGQIAEFLSANRTKPSTKEIGIGTILEVLGLVYGNAVLDVIYTAPDFRHVKPLLEQGRLSAGSPMVVMAVQSMVPVVLPQEVAEKLLKLTVEPAPVTVQEVIKAMEGM